MTKETIGSTREKLHKNYRTIDRGTIEAMKEYFGVEDYATLFKYAKDVGMNDSSSLSSNP
jgi:hypothetical protein